MSFARLLFSIGLSLPLALFAGCGESKPEANPEAAAPKAIQASDLPAMDAPIEADLDDGRVRAAPPKDWTLMSRHSDYVIRFKLAPSVKYPLILVTAKDYENIVDVTKDNVDEFVNQIVAELTAATEPVKLYEEVRPVQVKSLVGASYLRRAKASGTVIERFIVETVNGGRKYTVELRTPKGTLDKYRPYAIAVAEALQFTGAGPAAAPSSETPASAEETPAEETPAEEAPAEEAPAEEEPAEGTGFSELD